MVKSSAPDEDLRDLVESLKVGLLDSATDRRAGFEDSEYRRIRKLILANPAMRPRVPEWLRDGASLWEAVDLVRTQAGDEGGKWQRRCNIIRDGLNPLIEEIEGGDESFDEEFEILERIGQGGFGEVFRIRHKRLDISFALKLLNPSFPEERDRSIERFFREARILFRLNHSNIVRVHDVNVRKHRPFIRMEYVEGRSLNEILSSTGPFAITDSRRIIAALSAALAHAHDDIGVVHRDVKPSNIMLEENSGRIVLLDFGLGVFVEQDIVSRITKTGERAVAGLYAAPEFVENPHLIDPATDIYSLGGVWFTLLTGRAPAGLRLEPYLENLWDLREYEKELLVASLLEPSNRPTASEIHQELENIMRKND